MLTPDSMLSPEDIQPGGDVYKSLKKGEFDAFGFDAEGFDQYGFNRNGIDREGYDFRGYNKDGYDRAGQHYYDSA